MTTTLAAMATGSLSYKWVVAIEGYPYLLTDATTAAAVTAWAGSGYVLALGGLYVQPSYQQSINPWDPFENGGGRFTFQVVKSDTADTFGVDTHKKSGGADTLLTASLDCNDTTATVKSTAAFASSGTIYIGTEAITYSGVTATTFTGLTRGKFSPFLTEPATDFAHQHEITTDTTAVQLLPVVSATPRSWIGKWVSLRKHLFDASMAALNVKADSLCTFAGRIVEVRDNPTTLSTDVEVEHVLEYIKRAVLGDDMWSAVIKEGVYLAVNKIFTAKDHNGTTPETADNLVVVPSGASGAYQMNAGLYSYGEVVDKVNNWLAQALTDGDLNGTYTFGLSGTAWNAPRTQLKYKIPGAATNCAFAIGLPEEVERMFGRYAGSQDNGNGCQTFSKIFTGGTVERISSLGPPLRHVNNFSGSVFELIDERGAFVSQSSLPAGLASFFLPSHTNLGLVIIDGRQTAAVNKSGTQFTRAVPWLGGFGGVFDQGFEITFDDPRGPIRVQQYFHIVGTFADVIKQVFLSTGTAGHNHAEYDVLSASLGLAIPYDVLGENFLTSIDQLAHSDVEFALIITKPTKLEDAIGGALKLRFAFLRWISGGLQFWSWMTPTTGDLLEEANKASPADTQDEQRSASVLSDKWARNVVKVDYDRSFTVNDSGGAGTFNGHVTIIDRAGIDDAGGMKRVETIADQSSYSQWFLGGAGGVEAVIPYFREIVPMFTRPVRTSRRTIDPRFFEGYSVGDCVTCTDAFARDPDTGQRGVSVRPGIIVSHSYEPGGFTPDGSVGDMHGEVEIMFLDLLRVGPYVPCADVDSSQANGGLDAGTSTIFTCYAHSYSVTGESADASYMSAGRKIRIIERDPVDPAAPLSWDRVVQSQTGNTVTVTVAIGSPAWDASKNYRIVWDDYSDAIAAQQVYAYQADDADAQIADARSPYQYTTNTTLKDFGSTAGDANAATDGVELPPDASYGDAVGLDVGHHTAINRLINNLMDYKTARSSPFLVRTVFEVDGTGDFPELDVWKMRAVMPIFLSSDGLSSTVARYLYVAPHWRSSTGSSVSMRITLAREMPTVTNTDGSHIIGPDNYGQVTFTIASSTYATPTAQGISIGSIKDSGGVAYVLIEMFVPTASSGTKAQCYGLGTCYEGPRA